MSTDAERNARMWGVLAIIGAIFVAQLVVVPWELVPVMGTLPDSSAIYLPIWQSLRRNIGLGGIHVERLAIQLGATLAVALAWIFYATRERKTPSTDAGSASEPERLE